MASVLGPTRRWWCSKVKRKRYLMLGAWRWKSCDADLLTPLPCKPPAVGDLVSGVRGDRGLFISENKVYLMVYAIFYPFYVTNQYKYIILPKKQLYNKIFSYRNPFAMKEVLAHRFFWEHPRPGPKRSSPLSGTPRVFLARVHRYPRRGWMSPQRRFRCELGKRGAYRLSRQLSESKNIDIYVK